VPKPRDREPYEPTPAWFSTTVWGDHPDSLAPYVPSPLSIVAEMLRLSGAGPGDIVYDLGCGDGRILFAAVKEFKVEKAVGFDLDPEMVRGIEEKAAEDGVSSKVSAIRANFMEVDLSPATLVTLYLTTSGNAKLRPKLEANLRTGARVVSHDFPIHGWVTVQPDGTPTVIGSHRVFVYRVPDAYRRQLLIERTDEEENRWNRVRGMFTDVEKEKKD